MRVFRKKPGTPLPWYHTPFLRFLEDARRGSLYGLNPCCVWQKSSPGAAHAIPPREGLTSPLRNALFDTPRAG